MSSSGEHDADTRRVSELNVHHGETIREDPRQAIVPPADSGLDPAQWAAFGVLERFAATDGARRRFEFGQTIGQGGMGIVRLGRQISLSREVAIKTLRPDKKSPLATAELLQEAWMTGSLEHPNVVPVYDLGLEQDGTPVIVLKRISGVTWHELMFDGPTIARRFGASDLLEWNLRILMQVINAVRFAHSRGIVHRDLKPENVMIGEFGEVYVVDWGIAVSMRDDGTGRLPLARDATYMAGTPCYMAPEMLGGAEPKISERTDIYLLGAIAYEIVTGRPPHSGGTPLQLLTSVTISRPTFDTRAPEGMVRICQLAMAPRPEDRFANAGDLHRAIQDFLDRRGSELLTSRAEARFADLDRLLDGDQTGSVDMHREQIYNLYGACRFGFLEALAEWSDNAAAKEGLRRASERMVEYELSQDDARAAAALLSDISQQVGGPSPALRRRVEQALRAQAEDRQRVAKLAELGQRFDLQTDSRVRVFVGAVILVLWAVGPLIGALASDITLDFPGNTRMAMWSLIALSGLMLLLGVPGRSMLSSSLNRKLAIMLAVMMAAQAALHLGTEVLGAPPYVGQTYQFFLWFCVLGVLGIMLDYRLLPASVAYLSAFFASAAWPDLRFFLMAGANLAVSINIVLIWSPWATRDSANTTR